MKLWLLTFFVFVNVAAASRTFRIDYDNNQFLKDGQPFRYVSGSFHYFRVPRELWRERLTKMRLAGLNAVSTYVEWSTHEPEPGQFVLLEDVTNFIKTAHQVGLLVLLRPGPYICAEREFGGYPYWLLRDNQSMVLQTYDPSFLKLNDRYLGKLLPLITPLLYSNGGPVIMVQVENEYGTRHCDTNYRIWLRDTFKKYLVDDVVLYTTDAIGEQASGEKYVQCGKIDGVYATVDFGPTSDVQDSFAYQRLVEPKGPLANNEYYTGWIDFWSAPHQQIHNTSAVVTTLKKMLDLGASVTILMFQGGTNFGYKNSGFVYNNTYTSVTTNYAFNAPLTEAGDPTDKYYAIRNLVGNYLPLPEGELPIPSAKLVIGSIQMQLCASLSDIMSKYSTKMVSRWPMTFDQLQVDGGYVIYKTTIDFIARHPSLLSIPGLRDRAQVILNGQLVGTLSRNDEMYKMPLQAPKNSELVIVVENQGRLNFDPGMAAESVKGIIGNVTFGSQNLTNWTQYYNLLNIGCRSTSYGEPSLPTLLAPAVYAGSFMIPAGSEGLDTFLRLDGWGKGVAFVNGNHLGRYWPDEGPQVTLYVPHVWLKPKALNYIYVFETDHAPCHDKAKCFVSFTETHVLNGTYPVNELFRQFPQ